MTFVSFLLYYLQFFNSHHCTNEAAGNARKAEAADKKRAEEDARVAAQEDAEWSVGAKGSSKKQSEADKKAEAARKKAEREALLKEEEASLPAKSLKSKQRGQEKVAARRTGKIDDFISGSGDAKLSALTASGIDDALDALELTSAPSNKGLERHPERRVKAAYAAFEDRRLPELKQERPGLRLTQYKELLHKEFEKSPENPFNQVSVDYNATRDDVVATKQALRGEKEARLGR